jgi:hypothetical protein
MRRQLVQGASKDCACAFYGAHFLVIGDGILVPVEVDIQVNTSVIAASSYNSFQAVILNEHFLHTFNHLVGFIPSLL